MDSFTTPDGYMVRNASNARVKENIFYLGEKNEFNRDFLEIKNVFNIFKDKEESKRFFLVHNKNIYIYIPSNIYDVTLGYVTNIGLVNAEIANLKEIKKGVDVIETLNKMGAIELKLNKIMFVTRHGNSCNNILNNINFLSKKKDPSLSISGVITMLNYESDHLQENTSGNVYVSVSVRTWMTALLLYGRNREQLNLYVSPFIREELNDPGQMPETLEIQKLKFQNFMNLLKYLDVSGKFNKVQLLSQCKVSVFYNNQNICTFLPFYDPAKTYDEDPEFEKYCEKFRPQFVDSQPRKQLDVTNFIQRNVMNLNNPEEETPSGQFYSNIYLTYKDDGLLRFYKWVLTQKGAVFPIFVISHSKQMQNSLKNIMKDKTTPLEAVLPAKVTKANGWSIEFKCTDEEYQKYITPINVFYGVPKTKTNATIDKYERLCSEDQSHFGEFFDRGKLQQSNMSRKYYIPTLLAAASHTSKAASYASNAAYTAASHLSSNVRGAADYLTKKYRGAEAAAGGRKRSHRRKKRRTRRIRKR